jgi:hypothetical protein
LQQRTRHSSASAARSRTSLGVRDADIREARRAGPVLQPMSLDGPAVSPHSSSTTFSIQRPHKHRQRGTEPGASLAAFRLPTGPQRRSLTTFRPEPADDDTAGASFPPCTYGDVSYGYVSVIALVLDPGRCEAPSTGNTATGKRGPHDNNYYDY